MDAAGVYYMTMWIWEAMSRREALAAWLVHRHSNRRERNAEPGCQWLIRAAAQTWIPARAHRACPS
jgi:hypothetical protein